MSMIDAPARSGRPGGPVMKAKPAHHLRQLVERRAVLVRARQEALDRHVDEARIFGREHVEAEARAGRARPARNCRGTCRWRAPVDRNSALPSGAFRSIATLRLLRLKK